MGDLSVSTAGNHYSSVIKSSIPGSLSFSSLVVEESERAPGIEVAVMTFECAWEYRTRKKPSKAKPSF